MKLEREATFEPYNRANIVGHLSHRSPTPFSLWVEMLHIDHTLSHSPSPLVQVLPLWNHCSYLQMGTTQRASENFPSKIFPAEKAVPAQEK